MKKGLANLTTKSCSRVRLKCEFESNPFKIKISWFKNEAPIDVNKAKIKINRMFINGEAISILRLNKVDIHDSGFYKCEADNGHQKLNSFAVVKIINSGGHLVDSFWNF